MAYWLVKTEPADGGLPAFHAAGAASLVWDGVRNYQARNFLRAMSLMDKVLLYHASCAEIGVVGQLKVAREPYPDPSQFDPNSPYFDSGSHQTQPRWTAVDLTLVRAFPEVIRLSTAKNAARVHGFSAHPKRQQIVSVADDRRPVARRYGPGDDLRRIIIENGFGFVCSGTINTLCHERGFLVSAVLIDCRSDFVRGSI